MGRSQKIQCRGQWELEIKQKTGALFQVKPASVERDKQLMFQFDDPSSELKVYDVPWGNTNVHILQLAFYISRYK